MKIKILIILLLLNSLFAEDFNNISFSDFLRELSHTSGKNIVISGSVNTNFNVFLPSFDHKDKKKIFGLLKDILDINDLEFKDANNVILIYKKKIESEKIPIEEKENAQLYIIKYKNIPIQDLKSVLSVFNGIRFTIFKDRILAFAFPSKIEDVKKVISSVDLSYEVRRLSVLVFATDNTKVKELGADLSAIKTFNSTFVSLITSSAQLQSTVSNAYDFTAFINALHEKGYSNIINNPIITIVDGKNSVIESTTQIPITTGSTTTQDAQTVTTNTKSYKDVGLKLNITNVVIMNGQITFNLDLYIQSPMDNSDTPKISSKHINTDVFLDSNTNFFLGGINSYEEYKTDRNIPIIENIPLLGHLTRYQSENINDYTFSVFITVEKELNITPRKGVPFQGK